MTDITQLLGKDADSLLQHRCMTIPADQLYLPGADYVDRVMVDNNRPPAVLRNMQTLYNTGRLAGTGYLSILPVAQGVEHSAGASFAAHPQVDALFWGAEDLTAALGGTASRYGADESQAAGGGLSGQPGGYREVPRLTRALVLLHAAAAGIVALDAIHADTADTAGARAEAVDAAASGCAGTVAIHPGLVPVIRDAYRPDPGRLDWARRVVAGAAENSGAFAVDGEMIDAPLRRQAELILSRTSDNTGAE